ncbi:MAG TPA: arsenite efflux transporter metallochaperone ArsD [Azospirillum sp.]
MSTVEVKVYDPAMCCPTGVCGPSVDPKLTRFAADLEWLKNQGVVVIRFNLAQQPGAFVGEPVVKLALDEAGEAALPAIVVNGKLASKGGYPSREDLARMAGLALDASASAGIGQGCCGPKGCC